MKTKLLFLLLFGCAFANAQIVNIADSVFKSLLLNAENNNDFDISLTGGGEDIDINNDNEIQVSEALAVTNIRFNPTGNPTITITSLEGIRSFANLQALEVFIDINITSLDLSDLTLLQMLRLYDCNLSVLNLSNCTSFTALDLTGGHIGLLNCTNNTSLIDYSFVTADFNTVNFTGCSNLKSLNLSLCGINSIILTGCTALETLDLTANDITTIDVSPCTSLRMIDLTHSPVNSVTFGNLPDLEDITFDMAQFTSVDVSACPKLKKFECGSCDDLTSLDFSLNPLLDRLDITGYGIETMNLKNGKNTYSNIFLDLLDIEFVCIDEGEESYLTSVINSNPTVNVNTYCSFTPGGNYNTITGQLTIDADNNGCGTGADVFNDHIKVKVTTGSNTGYTYTNGTGSYSLYAHTGTHTVTPVFENNWFVVNPASQDINFANNNNNSSVQNFCITPNGSHPDVEVVIIPGWSQPGFDATYRLLIRNKGNQILSGDVTFAFDDAVHDYVSADPVPALVGTGTAIWAYTSLMPFESRIMYIVLNANGPMETPPLNNGDTVTFMAAVTPAAGDETPADNAFVVTNELVGSYDPNDITCLEGDFVHPDKIGDYLHYNINFENTGTAPATFIVVRQDINAADFDINSLQLLTASHAVDVRVTGNKVEYLFNNINLGAGQKGNFVYKIKSKNTLQAGDDVTAKANIYFDYNWPITTNNATTMFQVLSRGDFKADNSVTVYPNPSKGIVNIKADTEVQSVELYDAQSRLLEVNYSNTLDILNRATGMYFLKIRTDKGMKVEKLVKE